MSKTYTVKAEVEVIVECVNSGDAYMEAMSTLGEVCSWVNITTVD
jgi:hypothetical protein